MRRLLFFCFTALLCATSARAYDFENSDTGTTFYYNILSNSTVEVVGLTEDEFNTVSNSYTDTYIDIPETVTEGNTTYTVVGIGDFAFYNCRSILSLTMPNTVTYIGQQAFFADMYLETITFSTALTTIGVNAFIRATALTSITLPENVTTLEGGAFSMCTGLKEITSLNPTPPSCVETSSSVSATFNNVTLSNLTLYVPAASKDAYSTAPVWQDFGEILAIGEEKVKTPLETGEHFVVDDIRYCVVSGEDQTVEVTYYGTIAATVEVYKGDIVIPATVDYDEFTYTVIGIGKQTFEQCEMTSLQLPEGLLYIDDYAFYQCVIPTFEIPSTVTTIGDYVFRSCGITSITIPKTVTSIGEELFYMSSYYLQEVTLDANVNTLPANTFYYCTALTTVSLPSTLYLLKSRAFINCSSLRSITVHNPKAPICDTEVFYSVPVSSCTLYVPKGSREAYATADTWKDFSNIVELDEEAETPPTDESRFVEDGIYYQIIDEEARTCEVTFATTSLNSYSGSIDIPETVAHNGNTYTVTGIGYSAFRASTSLTTVSLPASITAIGTYAFYKCSSLKEIVIPSTITAINEYSFYNCSSLTELTIPENISFIGNYAFYGCTNIKTITIEDCDSPLEFENNYPFYGSALTTLYLGRNITCDTSDHYSPFYNFSTLKNITFSENVTTLVDYQFEHNSGLEEITLPHWITDIGANVFRYCTNLKKVVVAEGRTALGYYIFADCTALTEVSLPEGLIYPRTGAFSGCTALEEIVLPTTPSPPLAQMRATECSVNALRYVRW